MRNCSGRSGSTDSGGVTVWELSERVSSGCAQRSLVGGRVCGRGFADRSSGLAQPAPAAVAVAFEHQPQAVQGQIPVVVFDGFQIGQQDRRDVAGGDHRDVSGGPAAPGDTCTPGAIPRPPTSPLAATTSTQSDDPKSTTMAAVPNLW